MGQACFELECQAAYKASGSLSKGTSFSFAADTDETQPWDGVPSGGVLLESTTSAPDSAVVASEGVLVESTTTLPDSADVAAPEEAPQDPPQNPPEEFTASEAEVGMDLL